ncbi:MAG TPA: hypothetical protein VN901_03005 [Candidatus Acidoferrales bacterium]|nr:hypothetical protein [Candidatus Acidoferrales bacterium]
MQWGDLQLGEDGTDSDRFILVQHNYVRANTQLRRARNPGEWICLENSAEYLSSFETNVCWRAYLKLKGKNDISDDLVFQTPPGTISRS